jgi:DNA-directed RNA polymerase sigma subunit (sigma70/sigma32)
MSLHQVGECLGLPCERVRQIETPALRKARAWCNERGYALEDLLTG